MFSTTKTNSKPKEGQGSRTALRMRKWTLLGRATKNSIHDATRTDLKHPKTSPPKSIFLNLVYFGKKILEYKKLVRKKRTALIQQRRESHFHTLPVYYTVQTCLHGVPYQNVAF